MDYEFRQDESSVPSVLEQINSVLKKAILESKHDEMAHKWAYGWTCNFCGTENTVEYCQQCKCQKPHKDE